MFRVHFDESLKPYLIDGAGRRIATLPKRAKRDDESLVEESKHEWKRLRKEARAIAKERIVQLERAMCTRRSWSQEDYLSFFATHPLLVNLTRRILWCAGQGEGRRYFRLAVDGTYADLQDELVALPEGPICIPHPLDMSETELRGWSERFSDYEILQPFQQLGRVTFDASAAAMLLGAIQQKQVDSASGFSLVRRGWRAGPSPGRGLVVEYRLAHDRGEAAVLFDPGIYLGDPNLNAKQKVEFAAWQDGVRVELEKLAPLLLSEVARDARAVWG